MEQSWRFPHNLQLGVLPFPVTATLISICTTWILQVKNKHTQPFLSLFDSTLLSSDKQETLPSATHFLSLHPWESQLCLAPVEARLCHCHTACFVSIYTFHQESSTPMMPFPGFIYHGPTEVIQWEYIVRIKSNPAVLYNTRQLVKGLFTHAGQDKLSIKCHRHYLKHFHQMFSTF